MSNQEIQQDLKVMALEELSRHYGIKSPTAQDIQYVTHLLSKMPIVQAAFQGAL